MRFFTLTTFACLLAGIFASNSHASMNRIASRDTPAHRAAVRYMRGINFGNYLEYAAGHPAGNSTYGARDFDLAKAEGFDHVRIPVAWHLGAGAAPNYTISATLFQKADTLVNLAVSRGLAVIVDLHHFEELIADPAGAKPKFLALWKQVAEHYRNASELVAFEFLNEPNGAATTAVMNPIYAEVIKQTRLSNPNRTLFVGPGEWNGLGELKVGTHPGLVLPNDDQNIIVTVHCYDPYYFTHQGAEWALPDTATTGVIFPGPPVTPIQPHSSITHSWVLDWFRDYNTKAVNSNPSSPAAFQSRLRGARVWAEYWGRPVHVGEWGCYEKADKTSRLNFTRSIREFMDSQRLGWAMWDWKAGFHYMRNEVPDPPGMREAVFPPPRLTVGPNLEVRAEAAIGKRFVLQKAGLRNFPLSWQAVSTQVLATNIFLFQIDGSGTEPTAYRLLWQKL